jgi:hypothetical protein
MKIDLYICQISGKMPNGKPDSWMSDKGQDA